MIPTKNLWIIHVWSLIVIADRSKSYLSEEVKQSVRHHPQSCSGNCPETSFASFLTIFWRRGRSCQRRFRTTFWCVGRSLLVEQLLLIWVVERYCCLYITHSSAHISSSLILSWFLSENSELKTLFAHIKWVFSYWKIRNISLSGTAKDNFLASVCAVHWVTPSTRLLDSHKSCRAQSSDWQLIFTQFTKQAAPGQQVLDWAGWAGFVTQPCPVQGQEKHICPSSFSC